MSLLSLASSRRDHPELPLGQGPAMDTLDQQFEAFDQKCPEVYIEFSDCILRRIYAGDTYISPRDIFGEIRPRLARLGIGLNNSYSRFYGDRFKARHPQYAHLFREHRRPVGRMALHYTKAL